MTNINFIGRDITLTLMIEKENCRVSARANQSDALVKDGIDLVFESFSFPVLQSHLHPHSQLAVIGGGPAGLRAAEVAASTGLRVTLYDGKPSVGRKFLVAGKGGLNLTHGESCPSGRPWREFVPG